MVALKVNDADNRPLLSVPSPNEFSFCLLVEIC